VAAGGVALAAAVLLSVLPSGGSDGAADGTPRPPSIGAAQPAPPTPPLPATPGPPAAPPDGAEPDDGEPDDGEPDGAEPMPPVSTTAEVCADGVDATASYPPSTEAGEAVRRIQRRGELVVGVDQGSYLWGFRTPENGDIAGFDIDLARAIAEDLLGPEPAVVFRAIPTDARQRLLAEGEIDMVVRAMSITCDRWREVAFSHGYFETGQRVVVPRGSAVTGFDDSLAGSRVCSGETTTARALLEARGPELGLDLVHAPGHIDCLVLLQLGEVDALMTDGALAAGHAAQDPAVAAVGEELTREVYGVAMRREDVDLVRRVNAVLADYTAGGENSAWRRAHDRWLADHTDEASPAPPAPRYLDGEGSR
ncbi:glutamate ABC transporter substrate-binding protein, partial [Streptomyces bohaiensis]